MEDTITEKLVPLRDQSAIAQKLKEREKAEKDKSDSLKVTTEEMAVLEKKPSRANILSNLAIQIQRDERRQVEYIEKYGPLPEIFKLGFNERKKMLKVAAESIGKEKLISESSEEQVNKLITVSKIIGVDLFTPKAEVPGGEKIQ